ncbi:MAG TPA: hypothetical protein VLF39_03570 [Candidatus Saccharimonadales bacterium]|nr:hypothetical protein [Candidatus Saccharimonadales bacterium]
MIQFNLLPDIKQEFIRAKRNKHIIFVIAFIVSITAVGILVLLYLGVAVFQKKHMDDLTKDISKTSQQLKSTPDLDKILTIQNQLNNLDSLHNQKPISSRFFDFANKMTPKTVVISDSVLDFTAKTISFSGAAPDLSSVNEFVDTIKFAKYKYPDVDSNGQPKLDSSGGQVYVTTMAFSNVVLSQASLTTDPDTHLPKVEYQIDLNFDPIIFDVTKKVQLVIPNQITSRSETEKPTLFQSDNTNQGQGN